MGVLDGKKRSEDQLYEEAARLEIEEEVTSREETIAQREAVIAVEEAVWSELDEGFGSQ